MHEGTSDARPGRSTSARRRRHVLRRPPPLLLLLLIVVAVGCRGTSDDLVPDSGEACCAEADGWAWDAAPRPCSSSGDCPESAPYCVDGACRLCRDDADCAAPLSRCSAEGTCVECRSHADCPVERPACDTYGICERCVDDADCGGDRPHCSNVYNFANCVECRTDADCPDSAPSCMDGFCFLSPECSCLTGPLPAFPPDSFDCAAACAHIETVCNETLAGCFACPGLPRASCLEYCEGYRGSASSRGSAIWGCLGTHADCAGYMDCYYAACLSPPEPGACAASDCAPPLPVGPTDGGGKFGDSCTTDADCDRAAACFDGVCLCRPGFVACGVQCTDTGSDPASCGACGTTCRADQICCTGVCALAP